MLVTVLRIKLRVYAKSSFRGRENFVQLTEVTGDRWFAGIRSLRGSSFTCPLKESYDPGLAALRPGLILSQTGSNLTITYAGSDAC